MGERRKVAAVEVLSTRSLNANQVPWFAIREAIYRAMRQIEDGSPFHDTDFASFRLTVDDAEGSDALEIRASVLSKGKE